LYEFLILDPVFMLIIVLVKLFPELKVEVYPFVECLS